MLSTELKSAASEPSLIHCRTRKPHPLLEIYYDIPDDTLVITAANGYGVRDAKPCLRMYCSRRDNGCIVYSESTDKATSGEGRRRHLASENNQS